MDALEADVQMLCDLNPLTLLEIGSGSGCVISFVSKFLSSELKKPIAAVAIDINREAAIETLRCANRPLNAVRDLDALQTSLLSGIRPAAQFDIIIFNPPYVPSESSDVYLESSPVSNVIDAAWAGGSKGRLWTDMLLESLCLSSTSTFLSLKATVYIVALDSNHPEELADLAVERWGFRHASIVLRRLAGIERLSILRLSR